jgi:hypothetical protein
MSADSTDTPPQPADSPLSGTDTSIGRQDLGPHRDEGTPATDAAAPKPEDPAASDSPGSAEMPDAHPVDAPSAPTRDEAHAIAVVDLQKGLELASAKGGTDRAPDDWETPTELPPNATIGADPLSAVSETPPGQGADTADTLGPSASSPDTAPDTDQSTAGQDASHAEPDGPLTPMDKWEASQDRKLAGDIIAHRKQQDILRQQGNEQGAQEMEDFINKLPTTDAIKADPQGYLDGKRSDTESSQSSAEVPRMSDPGSSDGGQPSLADGLTEPGRTAIEGDPASNEALPPLRLEGPTEVLRLESPYHTMRSLFEETTLSDFADDQTRSPDGLPTAGQDVAPPNADYFSWPADSADADAWNQLPQRVRESFRGAVRMEEFHDGIGRIVDPDSSIDGGYWYRDRDAPENETMWRRGNAVWGQWNSGSSYEHLDGSEAPIKGWVGTTRGQDTSDGGWLPGGKEGIYIPPSQMLKFRDASVSGGKVPWRS